VIDLATLVQIVVAMLVGGLIIGLLWWLINYCEKEFPGSPMVFKIIRIVFIILIVLFLIGILLSLAGYPIVKVPDRGGGVIVR
jgi:uncharacterized membrane protein YedE/YeeE